MLQAALVLLNMSYKFSLFPITGSCKLVFLQNSIIEPVQSIKMITNNSSAHVAHTLNKAECVKFMLEFHTLWQKLKNLSKISLYYIN